MKFLRGLCCLMWLFLSGSLAAHTSTTQQNILVLHSYDAGYEWTRDFQQGIQDAADSAYHPIKLSIEYIDSKRVYSKEYHQKLTGYLREKYQNYPFDGILLTDDYALRFLNQLDIENIKNLPTVAAGINDFNATLDATTDNGVILYEKDYVTENLELIIKLRPRIKRLYYLADHSVTSNLIREEIVTALDKFTGIELIEIREGSLEQTKQKLGGISANDAVLLTHFNTEVDKQIYHGYTKTAEQLSQASNAPIFVLWGFYLKGDVLGGYVNHSYNLGVQIVDLLTQKLSNPIKVQARRERKATPVFQYHALEKYGIEKRQLPVNAKIISEPPSFWSRHLEVIAISAGIIFTLVLVILLLIYLLNRRREIHKKDKKIVALQAQTLRVQKNLIHVLGESIETRSGETGNHVRRVAKLSHHLSKLYGLSHRECDILETISPMHDVGKIGIPESILNKPGKLTPEEWALMQTHARIGFNLLCSGDGDMMNLAAVVSLEHHEHWDGNGYPDGKSGEEIHIFARITAIADVFDALRSERCYKKAWSIDQVVKYFEENSGSQFDPDLTSLFLENIKDFVTIRQAYPD